MNSRVGKHIPMSLRARVALTFGVITLLAIVFVSLMSGRAFTSQLQNIVRSSGDEVAQRTSSGLNTNFSQRLSGIGDLALYTQNDAESERTQTALELFQKLYHDFVWVIQTNEQGQIVAATDRQLIGTSITNQDWFRNTAQTARTAVDNSTSKEHSLITTSKSGDEHSAVYFSAPLLSKVGKFSGTVAAKINAEQINTLITRLIHPDQINNYKGVILDNTNHVMVGPATLSASYLQLSDEVNTNGYITIMAQTSTGERLTLIPTNTSSNQLINRLNWRLMIQQNTDQLFRPITEAWQDLAVLGSGLGLLIVLGYWLIAAVVIRPIVEITKVANRMRQGDTRLAVSDHSDFSEVAMLSTSLNTLVTGLAAKETELRSLNDTLNHKVHERTLELVLITDSLQNEITQRRELQHQHEVLMAELLAMASNDPLTRTFNRGTLFKLAEEEYNRARRMNSPLTVIMLDIDRFKQVNDTFGHAAGDEVLMKVSDNFRSVTRESDLIGRYGGEEFMFILPGTDEQGALLVGERLREAVWEAGKTTTIAQQWDLTASLGIAALNMYTPDLNALIKRADDATYAAKHNGRNRIEVGH